jgi:hypothetical protein
VIITRQAVILLTLAVTPTKAQQNLYLDGVGPIVTNTIVFMKGKTASLSAWAANESGVPIRKATWCVLATKEKKGVCSFTFGTHRTFEPGETFKWNLTGGTGKGLPGHSVVLLSVYPVTKFDPLKKLFIEPIEGNNGAMAREKLLALITNRGRFEVVEDRASADAILKGRSQTREAGEAYASSGSSSGFSVGSSSGSANGTAARYGNTVSGQVSSSGRTTVAAGSGSSAQGKTETIIAEEIVLRLLLPSGETLWAWDDTIPCHGVKAACAVQNLMNAAR